VNPDEIQVKTGKVDADLFSINIGMCDVGFCPNDGGAEIQSL